MAPKKPSKLNQITQEHEDTGKSVFGNAFLGNNFIKNTNLKTNEEDYQYTVVSIDDININDTITINPILRKSILERLVMPVILVQEFEWKEKAGRKYREKTGRYNIIDGQQRIAIYKEALNKNDENSLRYQKISALVLPLSIEEESIQKIKKITEHDKQNGVTDVLKIVTDSMDKEITYCYKYEMVNIPLEKIIERDNKYSILQSEIDEMEKSILKIGLLQPIVVLPIMNPRNMEIQYEIQAGHKRIKAIRQLIEHAKNGYYVIQKDQILENFETIPALLIPMGSDSKDIEKIYHDTNMLSRHMTTEDVFTHLAYFEELPSRPTTKEEFVKFKENDYQISSMVSTVQDHFKRLGFKDWKNTKTSMFLTVYFYGCDEALNLFENPSNYGLNLKEINWVVSQYKDFNERSTQKEILEKAIEDHSFLIKLMDKKTVRRNPKSIKFKKLAEHLIKQKSFIEKMKITKIDTKNINYDDYQELKDILEDTKTLIDELNIKLEKDMKHLN